MDVSRFELIIFDIDGTLVEAWTESILPNVRETIAGLPPNRKFAFATNQGGPALRYWMEAEGWGSPEEYPTFPAVRERLLNIRSALFGPESRWPILVSTAYQTKTGEWAPVWDKRNTIPSVDFYSYRGQGWLRPKPAMLLTLAFHFGLSPAKILFVGDGEDDQVAATAADRGAAVAAGMTLMRAKDFFGWEAGAE